MFVARAAAKFIPSGMNKSGSQTVTANTSTYTQITTWTADTATYPGSTVSSNSLVMQSSGSAVLSGAVVWSAGGLTGNATCKLYKNGTAFLTGSATPTESSGTATVSGTVTVAAGDLIALYFIFNTFTDVTVTASGTFVHAVSP